MKTLKTSSFLTVLVCAILLSIVCTGIYRQHRLDGSTRCYSSRLDNHLISEWISALITDNPGKALLFAGKMVPQSFPYVPLPYYYDLIKISGISTRFFNPPFTMMDYLYWKDSYKLRCIAKKLTANSKINNIPRTVFLAVLNRIKTSNKNIVFLSELWEKKEGSILDKYFLFSELMFQLGYRTQIVVLFPDTRKQPAHVVAEVRGNGNAYTCDFYVGKIWPESVEALRGDKASLEGIWKRNWIKGLDHLLFKTEIPAMSYRKINHQLHKYLSQSTNEDIPVIGLNPYETMENYQQKYYPDYGNGTAIRFVLGIEPFAMIKTSKFFPRIWLKENKM